MIATTYAKAQQRGGRSEQCDAIAVHTLPDRTRALVVLDGIGSSPEVRRWSIRQARNLARTAARLLDPEAALREVETAIQAEPGRATGEEPPLACALVAVAAPGQPLRLAWRGDVRAYAYRDTDVELLTRDHNARRVYGGSRNLVTSCLGSRYSEEEILDGCGHPAIETATVQPEELRLVIATDGAYEPHEDFGALPAYYGQGTVTEAAEDMASGAVDMSRMVNLPHNVDNASVLVVDLIP